MRLGELLAGNARGMLDLLLRRIDDLTDDEMAWAPVPSGALRMGEPAPRVTHFDRVAGFVMHLTNEAIHHGAEVALLRDLWRWRAGAR